MATALIANSLSVNSYNQNPLRLLQGRFQLAAGTPVAITVAIPALTAGSVVNVVPVNATAASPFFNISVSNGQFSILPTANITATTTFNFIAFLDA